MSILTTQIGQEITVEFIVETAAAPTSALWWVEDENGDRMTTDVPIAEEGLLSGLVRFTVPASFQATAGFRLLRLTWVGSSGLTSPVIDLEYRVLATQELEVQVNSFAPYNKLVAVASSMNGLDNFMAASREDRVAALQDAWQALIRLRFRDDDLVNSQTRLRDVPWRGLDINMQDLSAAELQNLNPRLLISVIRAQAVEADDRLGRSDTDIARESGLVSHQIGETRKSWVSRKSVSVGVSLRTLRELAGFISFGGRLTRV